MNAQKYLDEKKELQNLFLNYIDNETNNEKSFFCLEEFVKKIKKSYK